LAGGKKASKPKEKIRHAKLRRKMLNGDSQKKDTDSLRKGLIATRAETLPFGKSGRRNNRRSARGLTEGFLLWELIEEGFPITAAHQYGYPMVDVFIKFFHEDCWKQCRKDGKLCPMPKYA
jgi:hypothetical protein